MANFQPYKQELSLNKKIAIALKTIIHSKLKDNHDDTLIEKFCSLLNELECDFLEKLIVEENLFDLINNHLNSAFKNEDFSSKIDDIIVTFQICKSLLVREAIFKLYLTKSRQNISKFLLKIFENDTQNKENKINLLNVTTFSLINNIFKHETGKFWIFEHFFTNHLFIAKIFSCYDSNQLTHYVQNEIQLLLANIVNMVFEMENFGKKQSMIKNALKAKFSEVNRNQSKILYTIIDLILNKKKFLDEFEILSLTQIYINSTDKFDSIPMKDVGKLISLIFPKIVDDQIDKLHSLMDSIFKKLLQQNDCFLYSSLLFSVANSYKDKDSLYKRKFISFIQSYLLLLQCNYCKNGKQDLPISDFEEELTEEERILIKNTWNKCSILQFQLSCFQQLSKIDGHLLIYLIKSSHSFTILKDFILKINFQNKKHLNLLLTFFENLIMTNLNDDPSVISITSSIYSTIYSTIPSCRKSILQSIGSIFHRKKMFHFQKIFPQLVDHLIVMDSQHDGDQTNEEISDLVEIIVELVYSIIFEYGKKAELIEDCNKFLSIEYSLLWKSEEMEASCRANIISTLFMAHYCCSDGEKKVYNTDFLNDCFFEKLIFDFQHLDLDFRQQFFTNMKEIIIRFDMNFEQHKLLMCLACKICAEENDIELQLILWDLIDVILSKQQFGKLKLTCLINYTKFFSLLFLSLKEESFISSRVKIVALECFLKYRSTLLAAIEEKFDQNDPDNSSLLEKDYKFLTSLNFEHRINAIRINQSLDNNSRLNLLDDIIHTSTLLQEEVVMDCY